MKPKRRRRNELRRYFLKHFIMPHGLVELHEGGNCIWFNNCLLNVRARKRSDRGECGRDGSN